MYMKTILYYGDDGLKCILIK